MPTNDNLFDLHEAPARRFRLYQPFNSYITPYSKDTHGGELITEYNQRAALNSLLKRNVDATDYADEVSEAVNQLVGKAVEVDPTTGETQMQGPGLNVFINSVLHDKTEWNYVAFASGTEGPDDFRLAIDSSSGKLMISAGQALVYGYFIDAQTEVYIEPDDAVTREEVRSVADNPDQNPENPCCARFVKLSAQYTNADDTSHNEQLLPPLGSVYQGIVVLIDDVLPRKNELLLGIVVRDSYGRLSVIDNPGKSRIIPLDSVQGAENYGSLLSAIDDHNIYGVLFGSTEGSSDGEVTNLTNITPWLWINFRSNLGMLLRSMSTNAETAGNANDEPTRGVIVSDVSDISPTAVPSGNKEFDCLKRVGGVASSNSEQERKFAKIGYRQAQVPGVTGADSIDLRALYLPYANSEIGTAARSGVLRSWNSPTTDSGVKRPDYGTEYGILNGLNGTDGLMTYQQCEMLELVFMDYLSRQPAGQARGRMFGPFLTLDNAAKWFEDNKPTVGLGDYFWVINDTAEAGGQEAVIGADPSTYEYANIITNYGTVSGTVSGTAKQAKMEAKVTGSVTGTVTGEMSDEEHTEVTGDVDGEVNGVGQATINATVSGTVSGTLDSFVQNVSSRYVCLVSESHTGDGNGRWYFAHGVMNIPSSDPSASKISQYQILDQPSDRKEFPDTSAAKRDVLFTVESVERGFAIPATSSAFGVAKVGTGSELADVIADPLTQRLRITDSLLDFIRWGGFSQYGGENSVISITPSQDLSEFSYKYYPNGITFQMSGFASDWRTALDASGTLQHLRGHVTLDFTNVLEDGKSSDGLLLNLIDIDFLTLKGRNPDTESLRFSIDHSKVDSPFFTNIGYWTYSSFISGGNTLELDMPWMQVNDVFTNTIENSLSCRFSSITMGEHGISSAMLDLWIKHAGWEDYSGNIDRLWASRGYINFPPLFFEYLTAEGDEEVALGTINTQTIQRIPDNLNLRVSGTAGVHQTFDENNSEYIPSGNMLVNLNWEYNGNPSSVSTKGGKVYLNLYMKNSSVDAKKQNFSNLRLRMPVQVIRLDDNSMADSVDYTNLYGDIVTRL